MKIHINTGRRKSFGISIIFLVATEKETDIMPPKVKRSGDRPLNFVIIGQAETAGKKKASIYSFIVKSFCIILFLFFFFE